MHTPAHPPAVRITEGGLDDPRVVALLRTHLARARAETAPGSAHALDLSGLRAPDVAFWSAWEGDGGAATLVGVAALRALSADHGEVKSMHTAEAARGRGVGGALLRHVVAAARARGMTRVSLETGAWPYFAPARALYARHGFVACPPFGDYRPDPNSVFMTLSPLDARPGAHPPAGDP
jgi:putative acetyltransferase